MWNVGFEWDRYWLVVNHKGRACTQNVEPKLALVEAELPKEAFFEDWEPTKNSFLGKSVIGLKIHKSFVINESYNVFVLLIL